MATLKEIASAAGVSISTVSRALNGTAPISKKVKQQIMSIAAQQGYLEQKPSRVHPSLHARPLKQLLLAMPRNLMLESDQNLVSLTLINTLKALCLKQNIQIQPFVGGHDSIDENQLLQQLHQGNNDGILIINDDHPALLNAVAESGAPAVLINGADPTMRLNTVMPANRYSAAAAVRFLLQNGHRRILHLTWPGRLTIKEREIGYRDALTEFGLPVEESLILTLPDFRSITARDGILQWLDKHPDRLGISAIFCSADNQAIGVLNALQLRGISVPNQISLIGIDDILPLDMLPLPLTTLRLPFQEMAQVSLQLLAQQLTPEISLGVAQRIELAGRLVIRETVVPIE